MTHCARILSSQLPRHLLGLLTQFIPIDHKDHESRTDPFNFPILKRWWVPVAQCCVFPEPDLIKRRCYVPRVSSMATDEELRSHCKCLSHRNAVKRSTLHERISLVQQGLTLMSSPITCA